MVEVLVQYNNLSGKEFVRAFLYFPQRPIEPMRSKLINNKGDKFLYASFTMNT